MHFATASPIAITITMNTILLVMLIEQGTGNGNWGHDVGGCVDCLFTLVTPTPTPRQRHGQTDFEPTKTFSAAVSCRSLVIIRIIIIRIPGPPPSPSSPCRGIWDAAYIGPWVIHMSSTLPKVTSHICTYLPWVPYTTPHYTSLHLTTLMYGI
jgi:hypothetical protein